MITNIVAPQDENSNAMLEQIAQALLDKVNTTANASATEETESAFEPSTLDDLISVLPAIDAATSEIVVEV